MKQTVSAARNWLTYKQNRLLQEAGAILGHPMGRPSYVWLKVTHRCATRCLMCNIWKSGAQASEELTTDEWKRVLDDLRSWLGLYTVSFTGGEPFIRSDIVGLLAHAARIGLLPEVITRGVGVRNEEMAAEIVESGLVKYHVSIEGLRPEIHDHVIPPAGSLDRALRGLSWLNEHRRQRKAHLKIVIKTVIMGFNCDEIIPILDWVVKEGFDRLKFQPIEQTLWEQEDVGWYEENPLWPASDDTMARVIQTIDELLVRKRAGAPIANPEYELVNMQRYFRDPRGMYKATKAHMLSAKGGAERRIEGNLEIWPDGTVKTSNRRPPIGNAKDAPIGKLWAGRLKRS